LSVDEDDSPTITPTNSLVSLGLSFLSVATDSLFEIGSNLSACYRYQYFAINHGNERGDLADINATIGWPESQSLSFLSAINDLLIRIDDNLFCLFVKVANILYFHCLLSYNNVTKGLSDLG
jgi:hypothetical protein